MFVKMNNKGGGARGSMGASKREERRGWVNKRVEGRRTDKMDKHDWGGGEA